MRYAYPAKLKVVYNMAARKRVRSRLPDTVLVRFRDLPEVISEGRDHADALVQGAAGLEAALWFRLKDGEALPRPSAARRGEVVIELPPSDAAKIAFAVAFRDSGLSKLAFAKQLGVHEKEVRRMLDPKYPTGIEKLHAAMKALGRRLVLTDEAA